MTEPTPEVTDPTETLMDALIAFTGAVGSAVGDICSYGLTIGEDYVPFDPDPEDDCEEEEVSCSQLWVRVSGITPVAMVEAFGGNGCSVTLRLDLEVGVLRCLEIPDGGAAPTASDVLVAASQSMSDMQAIYCAAMGEEVWDSIDAGTWVPTGPLGGQYGGVWSFSVEF